MKYQWTTERVEKLRELYVNQKKSRRELAEIFGISKESIASAIKNRRMVNGVNSKFKPGERPRNNYQKGYMHPNAKKHQFKTGHTPLNTCKVGDITARKDSTGTYYWHIKLSETEWKFLHRHVWEMYNGPIPEDHVVYFIDNNQLDVNPRNLACVSQSEWQKRNYVRSNLEQLVRENSGSVLLTDKWIAAQASYNKPELKEYLLNTSEGREIIKTLRISHQLNRIIKNVAK